MYYRYEVRFLTENAEWEGVFQAFSPSQRRKWYCLAEPKYYKNNPDVKTRAWFTQHGYDKWHGKMDAMLEQYKNERDIEIRILTAETLNNLVVKGKTQCIQRI